MENKCKRIHFDKVHYVTFVSSILFGIISQGMGIFNKYSFHDDAGALFSVGQMYESGRWMLAKLAEWTYVIFGDGNYSIPALQHTQSPAVVGLRL